MFATFTSGVVSPALVCSPSRSLDRDEPRNPASKLTGRRMLKIGEFDGLLVCMLVVVVFVVVVVDDVVVVVVVAVVVVDLGDNRFCKYELKSIGILKLKIGELVGFAVVVVVGVVVAVVVVEAVVDFVVVVAYLTGNLYI